MAVSVGMWMDMLRSILRWTLAILSAWTKDLWYTGKCVWPCFVAPFAGVHLEKLSRGGKSGWLKSLEGRGGNTSLVPCFCKFQGGGGKCPPLPPPPKWSPVLVALCDQNAILYCKYCSLSCLDLSLSYDRWTDKHNHVLLMRAHIHTQGNYNLSCVRTENGSWCGGEGLGFLVHKLKH